MFAVRDQENLVHGHQQVAASKPLNQESRRLQPKTPGNKYPKTPLKVPLNDENAFGGGFGGKSVKGKDIENLVTGGKRASFDKNAFVTPLGPRIRAPLGAKTTNAKAKGFQTPAGPGAVTGAEKTQPQMSTRRPKKVTHPEIVKIKVHGDESPLRIERDVEYAPPQPKDLPYESEDFPRGCLDYEPLKKGNLMRGIYTAYHANTDEGGVSEVERRLEEEYTVSAKKSDMAIMKAMEEQWTVGDVPETFAYRQQKTNKIHRGPVAVKTLPNPEQQAPATIASRNAVAALSRPSSRPATSSILPAANPKKAASYLVRSTPKSSSGPSNLTSFLGRVHPRVVPNQTNEGSDDSISHHSAISRSTIGYKKGRSASGADPRTARGLTRSVSNLSHSSEVTITPARFVQQEGLDSKRIDWLSAFEVEDEELELVLRGGVSECLNRVDDDEEFVMFLE